MSTPLHTLSRNQRIAWRTVQTSVWFVGVAMVGALLWAPPIGIHAFWNVLIPVAPALVAFAPGLWRNICPMATTALFTRHSGLSVARKISPLWQGRLLLVGVILLFAIVPLRHVLLDLNGPATAGVILALSLAAIFMGARYEWKSGWCSGMCPVHPVERLYGSSPLITLPNAHCTACHHCVQPCADATQALDPLSVENGTARQVAGLMMVGGFPGFIWGWFQVRDYAGALGWGHLGAAYGYPMIAAGTTLALFLALQSRLDGIFLRRLFAAAAIACYYWYRLPALFDFGLFPGDGMLVDLTSVLPVWSPALFRVVTTSLFTWWLAGRMRISRSWLVRPDYAWRN